MKATSLKTRATGFTLVEALVTIAILGIMASVLLTAFSNAATDSARAVARQQQAAVQAAVNAWVSGDSNRVTVINAAAGTAKPTSISQIMATYNGATHSQARLALVSGYLDETSFLHFNSSTTNNNLIKSEALKATDQFLSLPAWVSGSYPQVLLMTDPN